MEKISDEELDSLIRWCYSVAFGVLRRPEEVTNPSWHKKWLALHELKKIRSSAPKEGSWVCNECGSHEYTGSVSKDDIEDLSCGKCGGNEFHWEEAK